MVRLLLLTSSYTPLFVLLVIRFEDRALQIGCAIIAALGLVAAGVLIRAQGDEAGSPMELAEVRNEGGQVAAYLATYLLPFLTVSAPTGRDVIAYVGFLVVTGAILWRANALQVNPLLALLRFRLFEVVGDGGLPWRGFLLSSKPIIPGTRCTVVDVAPGLRRVKSIEPEE
ncbi:hypothetical protein [Cellulomonas sp. PhB150]|uniref:hypothetical protein n=1 Tax=Cellulomonas sp. PhB150 TaxID=2485188 RepID=UPI000F9924BD|nr:hypothetical protein [Cellulomonas sp. PhB150]ROS22955.1 hypothetical protein EDF34_3128 [Cellulomonas sp. PhB150]